MGKGTAAMKIAKKSDVWHLIQRGMLTQLHFDFEATSLKTDFSQITAYGDAVGDIAGNLIEKKQYKVRVPERHLPNPKALIVTRTPVHELYEKDRLDHREAMARIGQRFEKGAMLVGDLPLEKESISFRRVRRTGGDLFYKEDSGTVLKYPLQNEKGETVDDVRIHPDRNMISYRVDEDPDSPYYDNIENNYYIDDKDGSKWRFIEPRLLVSGYRIKWYDIAVLRTNLVRAGFHPSNIFFTHSRAAITSKQRPKNYAIDGYSVAINTHLFGPGGEDGLKISEKTDQRTGEKVPSVTLSRVMQANTRYENKERGVRPGIRMASDNSIYDERKGHKDPDYDAEASFSVYNYARDLAPDVVKAMELQSDEATLREILPGLDLRNPRPPIFALMRNTFPNKPTVDPLLFAGFDDQQGQVRRIMMLRLDQNLRTMTYKGKSLLDMAKEDLKNPDATDGHFVRMIREQKRNPEAFIRLESVRRWPGALPAEDVLDTEAAQHWDLEQIDESFRFLIQNNEIVEAIRNAVETVNWNLHQRPEPPNPMMEEQWTRNGFGDLDVLEAVRDAERQKILPGRGATPGIAETLYNVAMRIYQKHNSSDELLHRLILQPHPVDYSDNYADLANYNELFKKVRKRFAEMKWPYSSIFEKFEDSRGRLKTLNFDQARKFRAEMMLKLLNDDETQRNMKRSDYAAGLFDHKDLRQGRVLFANCSRNYRVVDEKGRVLTLDYLNEAFGQHPNHVFKKLESGDWRVQFFRLSSEPSITATLDQFIIMNREDQLPAVWKARAEALKRLSLNGPPNEDPVKMRWETISALERELKALEINAQGDSSKALGRVFSDHVAGDADTFLRTDEGQRWLGEYREFIDRVRSENPMLPRHMQAVQYDPETGLAYDYIEHEIPAEDFITITVPDAHLRNPLRDIRLSPYSLIVPKLNDEDRKRARHGTPVVLRGEQTGRLYYGGRVTLKDAPEENESTRDYYEQARTDYVDNSGTDFPEAGKRDVLVVQALDPVADPARTVDAAMQSLKVPSIYFDGLTAPRLAHFNKDEPLTGLVMPADYCPQTLTAGQPIRFREMDGAMWAKIEGEDNAETGHIYETTLEKARRVTLGALYTDVKNGRFTDAMARRYGYAGAHDMWDKINQTMVDREVPAPQDEELLLIEFAPVQKESWAYFNPPVPPKAAFIHNGQPVPPSAYRWAPANQNGGSSVPVTPEPVAPEATGETMPVAAVGEMTASSGDPQPAAAELAEQEPPVPAQETEAATAQAALPEKGLVIGAKWADLIVRGEKTWELRKRPTSIRGEFGILAKGTGTAVGTAELVDCIGPLDAKTLMENRHLAQESEQEVADDVKNGYVYAWVLANARKFDEPAPYKHPSGAVTWVNLQRESANENKKKPGKPGGPA
jgi:hypothetical protein